MERKIKSGKDERMKRVDAKGRRSVAINNNNNTSNQEAVSKRMNERTIEREGSKPITGWQSVHIIIYIHPCVCVHTFMS